MKLFKHLLAAVAFMAIATPAFAAVLSVQTMPFTGLQYTSAAASVGDSFANDGRTFLLFTNSNASARTLTIAANATDKPGFGTITIPSTVVTIPGSGTNGGLIMVGPFPTDRFNDSNGRVNYTIDVVTGLNVAAVKLTNYP